MKTLSALAGALLVFGSLVGCNAGAEFVTQAEGFQKKMCDCKDKECTGPVGAEIVKWIEGNKGKKVSKANYGKIEAALKAAGKCAEEKGDAEAAKVDDAAPIESEAE